MLFSDTKIASYISENFEPAWKSLRPVPKVSIDFGNGNVVKRTLNGNIATYVCTADGAVVDVLPGVYQPEPYLKALHEIEDQVRGLPSDAYKRLKTLVKYHERGAKNSDEAGSPDRRSASQSVDASPGAQLLSDDTAYNERHRRAIIHRKLAGLPTVQPDGLNHWLYKDVLHADLDDPYLGLRPVLFGKYPFSEDSRGDALASPGATEHQLRAPGQG